MNSDPTSSHAPAFKSHRQLPSVSVRNWSQSEQSSPANNTAATTTISSHPVSSPSLHPAVSSKRVESVATPDKGSTLHSEAWEPSKFRFADEMDVAHIDHDGPDLSSSAKSRGKVRTIKMVNVWSRKVGDKDEADFCKNELRRKGRGPFF